MKIYSYIALSVLALSLVFSATESSARQWKPNATKAAQDYLNLTHEMKNGQQVFVMWIAPQYIDDAPGVEPVKEVLRKFTLIGIVHYHVPASGEFVFTDTTDVKLELGDATVLQALEEDKLPPLIPTFTTFLSKSLASGMGRIGQSIKYFTFDAGGLDGCDGKTFFVRYLDERYEYKGPIPGC